MKTLIFLALTAAASAQSTIDASHAVAYGGNVGWLNTRPSFADGVNTGEYVCSGNIYAANVGWISLGDRTADNGIRYSNTSATDWGVNVLPASLSGGIPYATLGGFAYGANIGWVNFGWALSGDPKAPRINLKTGRLDGYAYSANVGWINLADATHYTRTKLLTPAPDTDGDGIADAWELERTGTAASLTILTATGDNDGDGVSDFAEYLADTNPRDNADRLRITNFNRALVGLLDQDASLTWTSNPSRCYRIEYRDNLVSGTWLDSGTLFAASGATTSVVMTETAVPQRFYRVAAQKPLSP